MIRIALVGDHQPHVVAHRAIPRALALAAHALGARIAPTWLPTETITDARRLADFDALWCVPATPYRSMEGALRAIRFAREHRRPFLGTCGGFQHAIIEYARSVLGWADAEHAETSPRAARLVITPLDCALVEARGTVCLHPGSRLAVAYDAREIEVAYHCRYGLNPDIRAALTRGPLRVTAEDDTGQARAVEMDGHPFFVATLFQPEREALTGGAPPIAIALLRAAVLVRSTVPAAA